MLCVIHADAEIFAGALERRKQRDLRQRRFGIVELAPPLTDTPLFSDEFKTLMNGAKGMPVDVLAKRAIAGIKSGKAEIRSGQSIALKIFSRIAPGFIFAQMSKVGVSLTA